MNSATTLTKTQNSNLRGILLLLSAIFVFSIQDVIVKLMSSDYSLFEIVFIRTIFSLGIVLLILRQDGGLPTLKTKTPLLHFVRGFMMFMAYTFFFMALAALPYSLTVALFFSGPLFITALSVPLLGEEVGWPRWLAVLVGFGGVMIIVRPGGEAFDPATIFAISAAFCYAISIILTRKMVDKATSMATYTTAVYFIAAAIFSPIFASLDFGSSHPSIQFLTKAWTMPLPRDILFIFFIAVCWGVGMVLLSAAYRGTAVAVIAPFEYFSIFYGILFGFIFWRELPTLLMLIGIALIVGSGLFIIYRENRVGKGKQKLGE